MTPAQFSVIDKTGAPSVPIPAGSLRQHRPICLSTNRAGRATIVSGGTLRHREGIRYEVARPLVTRSWQRIF